MYLDLDLDKPSDVELEYINMSGQVVKTSHHKKSDLNRLRRMYEPFGRALISSK